MLPARRFNSQFGLTDFFNDLFEGRPLEKVGGNIPAINVAENENEYKLELAAPGTCKDDFRIHLNKEGNLVIEMEKKHCGCKSTEKNDEKKDCKYLRKEFSYSKFSQTLILPENADKDTIDAKVENGILYVRIPKTTKEKIEDEKRIIEVK
ncbi:MAG: Hsp20/alpha crystallin family protein [Bacteroidales bacterium]|nr:Hsp20/alpha crystallin family protein [Bacteroidales bacterium]MBQ6688220.1 Hsp20/alpha crystallin family protein [Bacteroidales bacterium]